MRHLLLAASIAVANVASAGDEGQNWAENTLTGDWVGTRTQAAKNGFVWEGAFKADALRNRGALRNGSRTVSHLDLKLKMDLEKAAGWEGGSAMINVIGDFGRGLNNANTTYVGSQMGVTNIEVGNPSTTRLFQAWVQQSLFDDKLAVLGGIYPIDSEFFAVDSAAVFIGPQYGTPAELAQTRNGTGPSIFNNAGFGFRARWAVSPTIYAMGAVLDGIPNDPANPKRTTVRFARGDGSFQIGEIGWTPEAENDKFKGYAKVAFGLWGYSAKSDDQIDVDAAGNGIPRRMRGGYLLGERTLAYLGGEEDRFLTGFARYTWSDGNSTALQNSTNLGVHLKGPLASRPDDIIGLAWTRGGLSSKWRQVQVSGGNAAHRSEDVLELTYRYAVTPYLAIQPNYQRILHPGGLVGTPNARVVGARLELAL